MSPKRKKTKKETKVSTTKKGTDYERMLKKIYESMLAQDEIGAIVEIKKKINIVGSHRPVEVDLYWEFKRAGVTHKVVVQAKDEARNIEQTELFAFHDILEHIPGQPVGLFITRTGFQKGAVSYANSHGIGLRTFRKPSDYSKSEKKPFPQIDVKAKVIKYTHALRLHLDPNWLNAEKQRLQITEAELEQAKHLLVEEENNINFYDEEGHISESLWDVVKLLYPKLEEDSVGRTAEFTVPTFVLTRDPKIPKLKVNLVTIQRIQVKSLDWFKITADDIVKGVLEDLTTGNVAVFNNELKVNGPTNYVSPVFDLKEFRVVE